MNTIAVIVVNYRTAELALRAVESCDAARGAFDRLQLMLVDGGSGDGSAEHLAAAIATRGWGEWVSLLALPLNGGFAYANNSAIAALAEQGPLPDAIALLNPDARLRPGALEAMAGLLAREPRAGAVGACLIHEDGRVQASAFRFPTLRSEFCRGARTRLFERLLGVPRSNVVLAEAGEVPWVTGAAAVLRTAALAEVGGFDDGFFLYFEETELLHRLRRAGWTVWHEPAAHVVHEGGAATQIRDPETGLPRAQRTPAYWYASRRRYFALAHGRAVAFGAGVAWLAGQGLWRLRQLVVRRRHPGPLRETRDLIAYGLWPHRNDAIPARPPLDASPMPRPAWMTARR